MYSVDPIVLSAVAQVISGGLQFNPPGTLTVNSIGGVGVMGISPTTAQSLGFDADTQSGNISAGAAYLSALLQQFNGNYPFAVAAYYAGSAAVLANNGVPPIAPAQSFVYNISNLVSRAGSRSMSTQLALENQTQGDPNGAATTSGQLAAPVGQTIDPMDTTQANSTLPVLQIDTGLGEIPWYADSNLITGNPAIRRNVQPVSFMVYLSRNQSTFLHDPATGKPITLQLNTSLKTFELQSKHVFNRTPSRTGMHITFWGMQPDLVSGTGTTGVFMNQYGLTDFFSTSAIPESVKEQIRSAAAARISKPNGIYSIKNEALINNPEALRVAAQDAFLEFLKLFQMNGNVWFYSPNYKGSYTGQDQTATNSFSPSTGATSFEQVARNNDVQTRGYVAMRYRNNVFLGYFKSLNWTQDAEKPFSWDFNFVFQVEKTVSALYWANASVTQFGTIGQALTSTTAPPQATTSIIEGVIE